MRIKINFASRDYMLARKVYLALALGILVFAVVFAANYQSYRRAGDKAARLAGHLKLQEKQANDASARLAAIKKKVPEEAVEAAGREAEFANAAIGRRAFSWTAFLNRLEDVVPDGVGIESMKPNFETLDVDISGTALDMEPLMEFVDRLTKSPYFEDIPPVLHTSKVEVDKDIGKTVQKFNFTIRYMPGGQEAPGASAGAGE